MQFGRFLTDPHSGQQCRIDGCIPSTHLPQKYKLQQDFSNIMCCSSAELPPKIDLRPNMTPVENQATIGSCVANALAGAYEYLLKKATGHHIDVSRLFIYYNARVKKTGSDRNITDSGTTITSGIEALDEFGTCLESVWPYDVAAVNESPNDEAYQQAEYHKIADALKIDQNLNEMKTCLAQGYPFVFGIRLFESFNDAAKKGVVPKPGPTDKSRGSHASHAMLAAGYNDRKQAFRVRNSWGEKWGTQGYCYISYDYLTDPQYCFDIWAIRKLETDDIGQENRQNNYDDSDDSDNDFTIYQNRQNPNPVRNQNGHGGNFGRNQYGYVNDFGFDPFGNGNNFPPNPFGDGNNFPPNPFGNGNNFMSNPFGNGNNFPADPFGNDDNFPFNPFGNDNNFASNQFDNGNDLGFDQYGNGNNFAANQFGYGNSFGFNPYGPDDGGFY